MSKYIAFLSWTSFFVLWWLLILGAVDTSAVILAQILLFGMLGALSGLPSPQSPPSGGNGRHAKKL